MATSPQITQFGSLCIRFIIQFAIWSHLPKQYTVLTLKYQPFMNHFVWRLDFWRSHIIMRRMWLLRQKFQTLSASGFWIVTNVARDVISHTKFVINSIYDSKNKTYFKMFMNNIVSIHIVLTDNYFCFILISSKL